MAGIKQVYDISVSLLSDCFYIVDQTRPNEAEKLFHTLREEVERRGHIMFVFNGEHFPLGFIKGVINGATSEINYLYVDRPYKKSGIGTALLKEYEKYCIGKSVKNINLFRAPTAEARNFYTKNGYFSMGNSFLMTKNLTR